MLLIDTISFCWSSVAAQLRFALISGTSSSIMIIFLLVIILIWALVYLGAIVWGRLLLFLSFVIFGWFMSFRIEVSLLWRLWNNQELLDYVIDILLSLNCVHEEVLVIRVIFVWIHHILLLICIITYHLHVSIIIVIILYRLSNLFLVLKVFFTLEWSDLLWRCELT